MKTLGAGGGDRPYNIIILRFCKSILLPVVLFFFAQYITPNVFCFRYKKELSKVTFNCYCKSFTNGISKVVYSVKEKKRLPGNPKKG